MLKFYANYLFFLWILKFTAGCLSCRIDTVVCIHPFQQLNVSSSERCSVKKGFLKIFAKFIENHLYWSLFFNKVPGLMLICWILCCMCSKSTKRHDNNLHWCRSVVLIVNIEQISKKHYLMFKDYHMQYIDLAFLLWTFYLYFLLKFLKANRQWDTSITNIVPLSS